MCTKFTKFAHIDKKEQSNSINLEKYKAFYDDFMSHVIHHRKEM